MADRKIYVGNLPPDTTTKEVEKLFSGFGKIIDIDIKNRNGPPFAFIVYDDKRDAADAIKERDGYDLDGFTLRVEFPREIKRHDYTRNDYFYHDVPRRHSNQYVPYDMYMHQPFGGHYGSYSQGGYFNEYRGMSRYPRGYRSVRRPRPVRHSEYRVIISNLPLNTNWQDLKDFMRRYGEVSYADVLPNGTGVCDFASKEDFRYVLKYINNTKFKSISGHSAYLKIEDEKPRKKKSIERERKSRSRSRTSSRSKSVRSNYTSRTVSKSHSRSKSRSKSQSVVTSVSSDNGKN